MASITSNKSQVLRGLGVVCGALDFRRRPFGRPRLGEEVAAAVAAAVAERTAGRGLDPGGRPLPRLQPATVREKLRQGLDPRVLVRTGEMTGPAEVRGSVFIGSNLLVMTAGRDEETRQKVEWAEEGSAARGRPARHFYEAGAAGEAAADAVIAPALDAAVTEAEGV